MRRKEPATVEDKRANRDWFPLTLAEVEALLGGLSAKGHQRAVLYGEVFGPGIQAYQYGQRAMSFRAFDLMVDDRYLDYDAFLALCGEHGVAVAPEIYRGPFSLAAIRKVSEGDSKVGGKEGREGVVVKPVRERYDPEIGRVILKYIGDSYLFGKAAAEDTTDL
jgi:RNA ligase (TIGR02306 family)